MELLTDRYANKIAGTFSCFDRVIIQGTLPGLCYAEGMTGYLKFNKIRIFDYAQFTDKLRNELIINAKKIGHTYKYYLTTFGKQVISMGLKLKELIIIPGLSAQAL